MLGRVPSRPPRSPFRTVSKRNSAKFADTEFYEVRMLDKFRKFGRMGFSEITPRRLFYMAWSAVDGGHVRFVVAFTGGRSEVVQPFDLLGAELDAVGGGVLLDAGDPLGAGDRGDVVALGEQPGQGDLCRGGPRLGGDGLDLVHDAQVSLEVLSGEARVGLAPVVVG